MQDIYDGREYQKHAEFLSNKAHVSLTMNTDGVAIFKSSKTPQGGATHTPNG